MVSKITALMLALILTTLPLTGLAEHSKGDVRRAWRALEGDPTLSPYAMPPVVTAPYEAGELTETVLEDALNYVNFLRWLAGLEPVKRSVIYDYQCQHAAVLLAALDYVDHDAPRPADMDKNFFDSAHIGTSSGCIARFNWMRGSILREGVAYFARDDGEQNLDALGHRRWLLNPQMGSTGFGLANAGSGMSYVVMYAHDLGNPDADWDTVRWPAPGAFPAELMHEHLAWSVSLNPEIYDLENSPVTVSLQELDSGMRFDFDVSGGEGDGFCAVNLDGYGAGGCVIFRPDFEGTGFTDYQQNQRWRVQIDHLLTVDGNETSLDYEVDMVSLRVQDPANIEISLWEATLAPGKALDLSAEVVPAYADDLSVKWSSSAPEVATVDQTGHVLAVAPGDCEIVCEDAMGHTDACRVTVE